MPKVRITIIFIMTSFLSLAQSDAPGDIEAHFTAIIVSNIDTSIVWYSKVLGLEMINRVESQERGFKQANLKNGSILIELIELDNAVNINDIAPNPNKKTRVIGFFKTGFLVADFDKWVDHLKNHDVDIHGSVVKEEVMGKSMVIIMDPDNNRIQLFEK